MEFCKAEFIAEMGVPSHTTKNSFGSSTGLRFHIMFSALKTASFDRVAEHVYAMLNSFR